jgi:hypothetical protein
MAWHASFGNLLLYKRIPGTALVFTRPCRKHTFLYEIERLKRRIVNFLGQRKLERYLDEFVEELRAEGVIPYG